MTEPTYYQVLQVDPNASPEVIEAAYRRLAKIYHPDANKSPDAKRKMKQINVAYQVLRDPVTRWQYNGTLQWHNLTPSSASTATPRPTVKVHRQSLRKLAWLKSQNRTKDGYFISIGNATDFDLTIELLKANVPAKARNYYPARKEWWISEDYENVLAELFHNFTARSYQVYIPPTWTTPSNSATYQTTTPQSHSFSGSTSYGKQSSNSGGWIIFALIVVGIVWWIAASGNGTSAPLPIATAAVDGGGGFATVPSPATTATTQPTSTSQPTFQPSTVRESNIREGPSPDYPIIRIVSSDTVLDIAGYNDDRGVVWYRLREDNWIWGDFVQNAPPVPYVPVPTLAVTATSTLPPPQDCRVGCTTRPTWCEPPVKGNVSYETSERIYHVAGQEFYNATKIDPRYGERWFCTEQEAIEAGWRKSYR